MKKFLIIFLLLPLAGFSQKDSAFWQLFQKPSDSTWKYIAMPDKAKKVLNLKVKVDPNDHFSRIAIIDSDSAYQFAFRGYPKDSLPKIDFGKEELVLTEVCTKCLVLCREQGEPCHRDRCQYQRRWYVRKK